VTVRSRGNTGKIPGNKKKQVGSSITQPASPSPSPKMQRPQAKHWCFTLNNPDHHIDDDLEELIKDGTLEYAVFQLEIGEEGTEHFQGFLTASKKIRLTALKKIFPTAHWEIARNPEEAAAYCKKEDSRVEGPWEFGKANFPANNGKVWAKIRDEVKQGLNLKDLVEKYPAQVFMYHKGISTIASLFQAPRDFKTKVEVWIGPPGTGKSRTARDTYPTAYWKQPDSIWWDGYNGETAVVLDDFYGSLPWSTLLQILDRYPMKVQQKGTTANFAPKNLVITSNKMPWYWYAKLFNSGKVDPIALFRRIDEIHEWNPDTNSFTTTSTPEDYLTTKYNSWKNSRENLPELYEN
jgi:hypothetical protein